MNLVVTQPTENIDYEPHRRVLNALFKHFSKETGYMSFDAYDALESLIPYALTDAYILDHGKKEFKEMILGFLDRSPAGFEEIQAVNKIINK